MRRPMVRTFVSVAAAVALSVTAGCGSAPTAGDASGGTAGSAAKIRVVASTNVWGDVAEAVGGDRVAVTSIISNPDADPHTYEASAGTALAIAKAAVVIENGGGYDDFMERMRSASKNTAAQVLDAVEISGRQPPAAADLNDSADLNEHVWYDFPTVAKVVDRLAAALTRAEPAASAVFAANAKAFKTRLAALVKTEASIAASQTGKGVAITEPVPVYLLDACGLVDRTPAAFSEAVENGTDVSARVLAQTLDLFTARRVDVLVYNAQTSGPETTKVVAAAESAGVPVVPVTETLPAGMSYLSWMAANLSAIRQALGA
jgi:zinc/manganese transport system substrate-binding protein